MFCGTVECKLKHARRVKRAQLTPRGHGSSNNSPAHLSLDEDRKHSERLNTSRGVRQVHVWAGCVSLSTHSKPVTERVCCVVFVMSLEMRWAVVRTRSSSSTSAEASLRWAGILRLWGSSEPCWSGLELQLHSCNGRFLSMLCQCYHYRGLYRSPL